jgi:hypothetical protein
MEEAKARTRVPLNSPMSKDRNPSWRKDQYLSSKYKAPEAVWQPGNAIFRRYANGMLDYDYACGKIFEAMEVVQDHGYLSEFEKAVLSIVAPGIENIGIPPNAVAMTKVRLAPEEIMKLRMIVAKRQGSIKNWRAGW